MKSFTLVDNPAVAIVNSESFIAERLYWFGERNGYEPEILPWWRHYCRRANSVLELGANIGYFTVQGALANPNATYVAVEPHPGAVNILRQNLSANSIDSVTVVAAAAVVQADRPHMELLLPGRRDHYLEAPCTGFLGSNEAHHEDSSSYTSILVPVVPISELYQNMDLIKLDIEGQEYSLLASMYDSLLAVTPTLFVELLDNTPMLRALLTELCSARPYQCFVPQVDRLVPLSVAKLKTISIPHEFGGTRDIIVTTDGVLDGS